MKVGCRVDDGRNDGAVAVLPPIGVGVQVGGIERVVGVKVGIKMSIVGRGVGGGNRLTAEYGLNAI